MTETRTFEDSFCMSFTDAKKFVDFLEERKDNSCWETVPSRELKFYPAEKDFRMEDVFAQGSDRRRADILTDTIENTNLSISYNGHNYPVRSCAIKTILERARISGNALGKLSPEVFSKVLNYCMAVANGNSLIRFADEKVSAVHGGDPNDYSVLEMTTLFDKVQSYLDDVFPGNKFISACFDHYETTALWSLEGQCGEILKTYREELSARGLKENGTIIPGLRFTSSDVGVSGANLYPVLLVGKGNRVIPLGYSILTQHRNGADMEYFAEQLNLLYARFTQAMDKQISLMNTELIYPENAMLGVLKRIGAPKKSSYEALEMFKQSICGNSCSAYEVYLAMSEIIFIAQCEGASVSRISRLEEMIAGAMNVNWLEYDRPGNFSW